MLFTVIHAVKFAKKEKKWTNPKVMLENVKMSEDCIGCTFF